MATMVIFLGGSFVRSTLACETIAVLLHYFVLASFCWMAVEAWNIYRCFVIVFSQTSSRFLLKASIFAWGKKFQEGFNSLEKAVDDLLLLAVFRKIPVKGEGQAER